MGRVDEIEMKMEELEKALDEVRDLLEEEETTTMKKEEEEEKLKEEANKQEKAKKEKEEAKKEEEVKEEGPSLKKFAEQSREARKSPVARSSSSAPLPASFVAPTEKDTATAMDGLEQANQVAV